MVVKFENSQGIQSEIGTAENLESAFKIINKFLDDHHFKSYYTRLYAHEDHYWVDVGSHIEFFYIYF